jgi:hypothetical protein
VWFPGFRGIAIRQARPQGLPLPLAPDRNSYNSGSSPMKAPTQSALNLLCGICFLSAVSCAMPVLVPTAVPLPTPSPTWTLLPAASLTPSLTLTPETVPMETGTEPVVSTPIGTVPVFSCPNAPAARVQVGDTARVTFTDGLPLRIRESPEVADDNVVTQVTEGSTFTIIGGPVCAPVPETETAFIFWEIELEASGLTGWVAEGDETAYYIEIIP